MKNKTYKHIVLFSGGLDSTSLLYRTMNVYKGEKILALSIQYGQKHSKELEYARHICEENFIDFRVMDLTPIFADSSCTLLNGNDDVATGSYVEQQKAEGKVLDTSVPFRNGLFLSVAASIAMSFVDEGGSTIWYGAHADDAANNAYPDCSQYFIHRMTQAIEEGTGNQVTLKAPYADVNKATIVMIGNEFNTPYEKTWSCYQGGEKHCGICATCIDRKNAFKEAGVEDPTEYEA